MWDMRMDFDNKNLYNNNIQKLKVVVNLWSSDMCLNIFLLIRIAKKTKKLEMCM